MNESRLSVQIDDREGQPTAASISYNGVVVFQGHDATACVSMPIEFCQEQMTEGEETWACGTLLPCRIHPPSMSVPAELVEALDKALKDMDRMKCGHWAAIRAARALVDWVAERPSEPQVYDFGYLSLPQEVQDDIESQMTTPAAPVEDEQ